MLYSATQVYASAPTIDAWNLVRVGIGISQNLAFTFNQVFLNDYRVPGSTGLNFRLDDTYVMAKWADLFELPSLNLSAGLESRFLLPVSETARGRGLIFGNWNRLLLRFTFSEKISLGVEEAPVLFWYQKSGTLFPARANEHFRNFLALSPKWVEGTFSFYLPIYLLSSHFHNFSADSARSGRWQHQVFLWPGITWQLTENLALGVNLMTGDLTSEGQSFLKALSQSVAAFEVTVSI